MTEEEIQSLTTQKLFSREILDELYDNDDEPERQRIIALLNIKARELNVIKDFSTVIDAMNKADKALAAKYTKMYAANNAPFKLEFKSNGAAAITTENFLQILRYDTHFEGIRYNLLSNSPEKVVNGISQRWTDTDDSDTRNYIEQKYKIHHKEKLEDALKIRFTETSYHPIRQIIESIEWDGIDRIPTFLNKWLKCDNTQYTREVSRLIFAGGINRLYNPGCKFDDVPVLIGTRQGEGKSTFVRWLALKDEFFTEICDIEGQKGVEALEGAWICEIAELLALTRTKDVEAVKSYITKQSDRYRRPFEHRVSEFKRQCIFIGTTNKEQFLTDKTGNRRFYPVKVYQNGYFLHENKDKVKSDILQAWAEAKVKMESGEMKPYADMKLINDIKKEQQKAVEDDYREGLILSYIEDKTEVCIMELWEKALNNISSKPTKRDSNDIALILQGLGTWIRSTKPKRIPIYGLQRTWSRMTDKETGFYKANEIQTPFDSKTVTNPII